VGRILGVPVEFSYVQEAIEVAKDFNTVLITSSHRNTTWQRNNLLIKRIWD
jgi:hypothetical protein